MIDKEDRTVKNIQKIKKSLMGIYGVSAVITACIYLMSTFLLPAVFNAAQLHMNIRNGILVIVSVIILFISGMMIPTIIYLTGNKRANLRTVNRRAIMGYIARSRNGILFFMLSSVIWSALSGCIALALFAVLKNNASYESIKLIIQATLTILTIFIAPLILMETFSMMLKHGTAKYRLKYGWYVCRRNYFKLLIKILLLFLIGLIISVIGLFLRVSIAGDIILFIIWSLLGGASLIYITEYILEIFKRREPENKEGEQKHE